MNRRGFLGSILVAAAAPAIVRADALMRVVPLETTLVGVWWGFDRDGGLIYGALDSRDEGVIRLPSYHVTRVACDFRIVTPGGVPIEIVGR